MTLDELREYILSDPDDLGLVALAEIGNDAGIAGALNNPLEASGLYVPRDVLEVFLIGQGIAGTADLVAQNAEAPSALRVACISMGKMLLSAQFPQLNLSDPATVAMQAGLIAGGVMSQAQSDALTAIATTAYKSKAQVLWGADVVVNDVSECLVGHRKIGGE